MQRCVDYKSVHGCAWRIYIHAVLPSRTANDRPTISTTKELLNQQLIFLCHCLPLFPTSRRNFPSHKVWPTLETCCRVFWILIFSCCTSRCQIAWYSSKFVHSLLNEPLLECSFERSYTNWRLGRRITLLIQCVRFVFTFRKCTFQFMIVDVLFVKHSGML